MIASMIIQWHRTESDGTAKPLSELEIFEDIDKISDKYLKWKTPRLWRWIKAEPN